MRNPVLGSLRRELRFHSAPWAIDPAVRALAAGAIIGAAAWIVGSPAAGGVAYFGASCAITFSVLGSRRERLTRAAAQAGGAVAGLALAGLVPHGALVVTVAAVVCGFASGVLGTRGPAWTAFSLMLLVGLAYGRFSPVVLPWYQQCAWYAVGAAAVVLVVALPGRSRRDPRLVETPAGFRPAPVLNGLRIALCFGLAMALAGTLDAGRHSFWLPLTVAVIVRGEYGSIVSRTTNRVVGTIVGALVAALVITVWPSDLALAIVAVLAIGFAAAAAPKLYALSVIGITASALLSTEIGATDPVIPLVRVADTLLGAAIAVVLGLLLWPRALRDRFSLRGANVPRG